jgi:hypothetical protein
VRGDGVVAPSVVKDGRERAAEEKLAKLQRHALGARHSVARLPFIPAALGIDRFMVSLSNHEAVLHRGLCDAFMVRPRRMRSIRLRSP